MGIWDYFSSPIKTVKQITPDLTAVKNIWGYGWSAVNTVDNAVRVVAAEKVNQYLQDDEARSEMTRIAADFAKTTGVYVIEEGIKTVPGGALAHKILTRSLKNGGDKKCDDKESKNKDEKIKELCARIEKLEKQSRDSSYSKLHEQTEIQSPDLGLKSSDTIHSDIAPNQSPYRKLHEQTEIQGPNLELKSSETNHFDIASNQSPKDVIRVFMMKEFMGTRFLDDLIVPKVGNTKKT